jgi:hypothetical protein
VWFLFDEDEEYQMSVVNEWLDDMEAERLSAESPLDEKMHREEVSSEAVLQ